MAVMIELHIEAPVARVFDFIKDPRNWQGLPHTGTVFTDVTVTAEGVGSFYSWAFTLGGLPVTGFDVVTEFVPNQRITVRSSRSFLGTWGYSVQPEGSGTKLTMDGTPRGLWRLPPVHNLMYWVTTRGHEQVWAELKAALEARSSTAV